MFMMMQANLNQDIWNLCDPEIYVPGPLSSPSGWVPRRTTLLWDGSFQSNNTGDDNTLAHDGMGQNFIPNAASKTFHNSRDDNWEHDPPEWYSVH